MNKLKGLISAYKEQQRWVIKVLSFLAILTTFYSCCTGASKEGQEAARKDREKKHNEIKEKFDGKNDKKGSIISSKILVDISFKTETKLNDFNGAIASRQDTCYLITKSGDKIDFKSTPGTTKMIRNHAGFRFIFETYLQSGFSIYGEKPLEFYQAQKIIVPLNNFSKVIMKKIDPDSKFDLDHVDVSFDINGQKVGHGVNYIYYEVLDQIEVKIEKI